MAKMTWRGAAVVGLLAATVSGCAHERRPERAAAPPPPQGPAQQAQRGADTASRQAASTEQQLTEARRQLDVARQESVRAQDRQAQARQQVQQADQAAAAAQQRIGAQQANVAQLEQAAREQRQAATDAAMQAQIAAEEAQGLRSAAGRIAQTSPGRMVLQSQDGRTMSFQLQPRTRVLMGTEQRSVTELQQGAEARVAYDPREPDPAAVTIHVSPAGSRTPLQPAQQPSQAPAQPSR